MLRLVTCGEQTTVTSSAIIECRGFYHGGDVSVTFKPAPPNAGIVFEVSGTHIRACYKNSISTPWHITAIGYDQERCVHHVEHVLSAVRGLGIDNIAIQVDGVPFLPILDGSALQYVDTLRPLVCSIPGSEKKVAQIVEGFTVLDPGSSSFAVFRPADEGLEVTSLIHFPETPIGTQIIDIRVTPDKYAEKIAPARTFLHKPYTDERWERVRELFKTLPANAAASPIIVWHEDGYVSKLRFPSEPGMHKVLDFIGDTALCGYELQGYVFLNRPSHQLNRRIAARLATYV